MRVDPRTLNDNLEGLTPARDERFLAKLAQALDGTLPIYFAAVPLCLCIPFDMDYRPDLSRVGASAIGHAADATQSGNHAKLITYQRGYWFVVSDDYIPYFAALAGLPDYIPCFIMGKPDHTLIQDLQGPIDREDFRKYIGLA